MDNSHIRLTEGEEALIAAGELDLDTLLAEKALESRYGPGAARLTEGERSHLDALRRQWSCLDVLHYNVLYAEMTTGVETPEKVAEVRARMRYVHFAIESLHQKAAPVSVAALEEERLEALAHQNYRDTYRLSAVPFLHTDRWWEPGYVPEGAAANDPLDEGR